MISLSDNKNYIDYMVFKVNGDVDRSIQSLMKCIQEFRDSGADAAGISFLYQKLGTLKYLNGDSIEAFKLYEESLKIDDGSLLAELHYAKFLANECKLFDKALEKCNFIIDTTTRNSFPESGGDFDSNYYFVHASELKEDILARLDQS